MKVCAILLCLALTFPVVAFTVPGIGSTSGGVGSWRLIQGVIGDLNNDRVWDSADLQLLEGYLAGLPAPTPLFFMDVHYDYQVNGEDLIALKMLVWSKQGSQVSAPEMILWFKVGDLNGDRQIDRDDLGNLQRYLEGEVLRFAAPLDAADVNLDGRINQLDRIVLARSLL